MKIAIPSTRPDLDGAVEHKLGTAAYLLIIETGDMSFTAVAAPAGDVGQGAGIAMVSLALDMDARALLVGYVAPHIAAALRRRSIDVATGVSGSTRQAVADYLRRRPAAENGGTMAPPGCDGPSAGLWRAALRQGLRQMLGLLPRIAGVVLLLGLFKGFVSQAALRAVFTGSTPGDELLGGALGSILAGNPANSYVLGDGLLRSGVGMAGVLAFMLTWAGVGLIQLPVEGAALGWRFALVRNLAAFVFAVAAALLFSLFSGGGF